MKKEIYLVLAGIGLATPYWFFLKFITVNGFDLALIMQNLFANQISTFFALDLVVATIVFWFFTIQEARKLDMKNIWLYMVASLAVGLSFALPLFLYFREHKLNTDN